MGHGYSYTEYGYCHPGMRNPPRYWAEPRSLESTDVRGMSSLYMFLYMFLFYHEARNVWGLFYLKN